MQLNKRQTVGWITLLMGAGSWYGTASAGTLLVCPTCNHTTIQSAVNDAADNDIIKISAGRYSENITISGKGLTLLGAGSVPNGETLVLAAGRGPVFTLGSGTAGDANHLIILDGMVISGGNHNGGTGVGGGVQVRSGAYVHLLGCAVRGNYATFGGGVGINSPGAPPSAISGGVIADNVAPGGSGGLGHGGGVYVAQGSTLGIGSATIARNSSGGGGGIYGEQGSTLNIATTTVTSNTTSPYSTPQGPTDGDGGGMETQGDFTISDSTFVQNSSFGTNGGGGLAIAIYDSGPHTISRSIFSHDTVALGDGTLHGSGIFAYAYTNGTYTLDHSFVVQNVASQDDPGYAVWNASNVTAVITNTVISDNVKGDLCNADTGGGCK